MYFKNINEIVLKKKKITLETVYFEMNYNSFI